MSQYNSDDITEIARQIRTVKNDRPFVMLTGAGCSVAAGIPTAQAIIKEIYKNTELKPFLKDLDSTGAKDYGRVMECLDLTERENILKEYLTKAKVNWGHIAMASMLNDKHICRVLTFNFDNILARACGKCGLYPQIYDFVSGVSRSGRHIVDPAIVHLHGQGFGIAMLNSEKETQDHAENLRPLLNETMEKHPLLIIGYSGQSDRVFPIIQEGYRGRNRIHWVDLSEKPNENIAALQEAYPSHVKYYGSAKADQFLVELAQALSCFPPNLFDNTIQHLRDEIRDILPFSKQDSSAVDVKEKLEAKLQSYDDFDIARAGKDGAENPNALSWYLEGQYKRIIEAYEADPSSIPADIASDAYGQAGLALGYKAIENNDLKILKNVNLFFEKSTTINSSNAESWNNWGVYLGHAFTINNDIKLIDEIIEKYRKAAELDRNDPDYCSNLVSALTHKFKITNDTVILKEAQNESDRGLILSPTRVAYNAACLASVKGDLTKAKIHLETCKNAGTLPSVEHLLTDEDLSSLHEKPWFKDFIFEVENSKP